MATITETGPIAIDVPTTDEPPLVHIIQSDWSGRPRDHALCGEKISKIVQGGSASCKECVRIRLGIEGGRWAKL